MQNQTLFDQLRQQHPTFTYKGFQYQYSENQVDITFDFRIGNQIRFAPAMHLTPGKHGIQLEDPKLLEGLIFHIGLIELISYWKAACCPTVHICGYRLSEQQQQ